MNKKRINYLLLAVLLIFPYPAQSDNFFRMALLGYQYSFPKDHFSHPDFQTEWWYYTGHLTTEDGKNYGYKLTFFRTGIESQRKRESESSWVMRDIYFAHMAISDENKEEFRFWEKINRKGPGLAGAEQDRLLVWNEGWRLEGSSVQPLRIRNLLLNKQSTGKEAVLQLGPTRIKRCPAWNI